MKKGGYYFYVALLLIVLAIALFPVVAGLPQLQEVTLTGKDGVRNILTEVGDRISIQAKITGLIQKEKVQLLFQGRTVSFTSCTQQGNDSLCIYSSAILTLLPGKYPYSVNVIEGFTPVQTISRELYVDGFSPNIDRFSLEFSSQANSFHVAFAVRDSACEQCPAQCSGIAHATLVEDQTAQQSFEITENICSVERSLDIPLQDLSLEDGYHNLCFVATDRTGHESERQCQNISIDTQPPEILQDSPQFVVNGAAVTSVAGTGVLGSVVVNVTDFSLDLNKVFGDFSALNPQNPSEQRWRKATCSKVSGEEDLYTCTFENIVANKPQENPHIVLNLTDLAGNSMGQSVTLKLIVDSSAPSIVKLYSIPEARDLSALYVNSRNSITAEIAETGSGFSKKNGNYNAYLKLGSLSQKMQAKNCTATATGVWNCIFEIPLTSSAGVDVTDFYGTKDDSGNVAQGGAMSVFVDTVTPLIGDVTLSHECPTADQVLTLKTLVQDTSPVFISTIASRISDHREPVSGECVASTQYRNSFECSLDIDGLSTGYVDQRLQLKVKDAAGNEAVKDVPVKVCEIEEERTPEFITLSYGVPPKIDKRTLSFIPIPIYIPLSYTFKSNAEILDARAQCTNADEAYFVNDFNTLVVKLSQYRTARQSEEAQSQEDRVKELPVNCVVQYSMKRGTRVYSAAEQENVTLRVPLYNNPLGSLDQAMQKSIDEAKKRIDEIDEQAGKWKTLNMLYGNLCRFSEAMGAVNSAWQTGKAAWYASGCPFETSAKAACGTLATELPACFAAIGTAECLSEICPAACAGWAAAGCGGGAAAGAAAGGVGAAPGCAVGAAIGCGAGLVTCGVVCPTQMATAATLAGTFGSWITTQVALPTGSPEFAMITGVTPMGPAILASAPLAAFTTCLDVEYLAMVATCTSWLSNEISWKEECAFTSYEHNFVDNYVWPVGLYGGPVGTINKYACMVFNKCALTDTDTYVEIGVDLGGYGLSTKVNSKGALGYKGKVDGSGKKIQPGQVAWSEAAKANMISGQGTGSWLFDPFKNKDVAKYTACLPAWIFALEKEKQINCIRKTCLEQHAKAGLPPDDCQLAFKERKCLYVDGATATGFESGIFESVGRAVLANLPNIVAGLAWKMLCAEYITAAAECYTPGVCVDHYNVGCAVGGALLTVAEIAELVHRDGILFEKQRELTGTDYCTTES